MPPWWRVSLNTQLMFCYRESQRTQCSHGSSVSDLQQRFFFFFKLIFTRVQLVQKVVLVSTVQQNESAIHVHIPPPFWTSHSGHHSALSGVPCAARWFSLFYTQYLLKSSNLHVLHFQSRGQDQLHYDFFRLEPFLRFFFVLLCIK